MSMDRATKLAIAGLAIALAWVPIHTASADEAPQTVPSSGIPGLAPGQGYVAIAINSPSTFYTLKYKRPGEDSEHVAVEDIPVGRKVVFVPLPAGTYSWSRVEFGKLRYLDYIQFRNKEVTSYVQFKGMEKALTFTVKAGVVNYPGDLVLTRSDDLSSYAVKTLSREATLIAGLNEEQRATVKKYGIVYSGVSEDHFFDQYDPTNQASAPPTVAASSVSTGVPSAVSTADFFRQPLFVDALISPDGHLVASLMREEGRLYISIDDLATGISGTVYQHVYPEGKIDGMRWISDDTLVFYSYLMVTGWNNHGDMYSIVWEVQDGKAHARQGAWGGGNWVASALDGKGREALVAQFPDSWGHTRTTLYKIDMGDFEDQFDSSHRVTYLNGEYPFWLAKTDATPGVIGLEDANGGHQYQMYVASTGKWTDIKSVDPSAVFMPLAFQAGTDDLVVKTAAGLNAPELWLYDPLHDKLLSKIYGDERYGFDDVLYGGYDHHVVGVSRHSDLVQDSVVFDAGDPAIREELNRLFPGSNAVIRDSSRDDKRLLIYASGTSTPGAVATFDTDTKKLTDIAKARPWLDKATLATMDANSVVTKSGAAVDYMVSMPLKAHAPIPTVVILHDGALLYGFDPRAQYLTSKGFAVVDVDYAALATHAGPQAAMSPKQREFSIEEGIAQVLSSAAEKYAIDKTKVCIYGSGSAGYFALMGAIDEPSVYKCSASYSGVTDLSLIYEPGASNEYLHRLSTYLGINTQTSSTELVELSPAYLTSKMKQPVFIGQGADDGLVDEEHAYRLEMMLDKAGPKHELHVYQNEGHDLTVLDNDVDFYERLYRFVDTSINAKDGE